MAELSQDRVGKDAAPVVSTGAFSDLSATVLSGNFPLVVKHILSYLPAKVLNTASRVCKQWNQLAAEIRGARHSLSWFMAIPDRAVQDDLSLAEKIQTYLQGLWSEPETVLVFLSSELYSKQLALPSKNTTRPHRGRAAKCVRAELEWYIQKNLPAQCKLFGAVACGAVGTKWESERSIEVEADKAMTMLVLPKYPGIDVLSFTMDIYSSETNWHMDIDELESKDVNIAAISGIPADKTVKAVLFFCDEPFCPPEIGYSILNQYKEAVVAGGYVDDLVIGPKTTVSSSTAGSDSSHFPTILCLAFCGDNLRVSSVLIKESINSPDEAEKQIMQLKTSQVSVENSFAFMFACVGRGEGLYGKENVEADAFRKVFPRTPLFGFFGNGEIGYNSLPGNQNVPRVPDSDTDGDSSSSNRILPKLYHAYTTIICLFSVV